MVWIVLNFKTPLFPGRQHSVEMLSDMFSTVKLMLSFTEWCVWDSHYLAGSFFPPHVSPTCLNQWHNAPALYPHYWKLLASSLLAIPTLVILGIGSKYVVLSISTWRLQVTTHSFMLKLVWSLLLQCTRNMAAKCGVDSQRRQQTYNRESFKSLLIVSHIS